MASSFRFAKNTEIFVLVDMYTFWGQCGHGGYGDHCGHGGSCGHGEHGYCGLVLTFIFSWGNSQLITTVDFFANFGKIVCF